MSSAAPKLEYEQRLRTRREAVARFEVFDGRASVARGLTFLAGVTVFGLCFALPSISRWLLGVPIAVFCFLVVYHARIAARLKLARNAVDYYQTAIDRIEDRWTAHGETGERYQSSAHLYSGDLDIFGRHSLFQLLCQARTRLGEDLLADWLTHSATVETVRTRQACVDELRNRLDLRETIALLDAQVHSGLDQNRLIGWAQETPQPIIPKVRLTALILAIAGLASLVAWLMFDARFSLFAVVLFLQVLFTFAFRKQIQHLANTADEAGSGLAILSQVLELLERERFQSPGLAAIRAWLDTEGMMPSKRIAQLHGLIQSLNNSMKNQFFAPLAILLCLPVQLVHRIEVWRGRVGTHIPEWLEAVGQFEALSSLAGYAYEHPADPFPELVTEGPLFTGEALGHPLLPDSECIRNDLTLNAEKRLILISGSNMSGKSTLLRTVGTNVVLALAGAPVRAARLQLSRVEIGSAMRINDSLQDGRSLFYTSLSRLKAVVDLSSQSVPLLFLLDEILQGTNSHDRRIGAEGIIRRLIEGGAAGIVTTHDLALTKIVDAHDAHAVNMHFEDHFIDGKMTFDYRIRPGVVQRSNALELMRMMGLDV